MKTDTNISYNSGTEEFSFDLVTQEETRLEKNLEEYSYYADVEEVISFVQSFNGTSSKQSGRRGIDEDETGVLDEITHYFYDLDWVYGDALEINFYVHEDTSNLRRIYIMDHNKNESGKRHFQMWFYITNPRNRLKEEYDNQIKSKIEASN